MIPSEVAAIATLIWPGWEETDSEASKEVVAAAWRIFRAGYRQPATPAWLGSRNPEQLYDEGK